MSPEEAEALQAEYVERRAAWAEEINRPFPQRRTSKRKPEPGVVDAADEEMG